MELVLETVTRASAIDALLACLAQGERVLRTLTLADGAVSLSTAGPGDVLQLDEVQLVTTHGPSYRLLLIGAGGLCWLLCWLGLQRTRLGLLLRAASQNPTMTAALGNDVGRVRAMVFALACALAALGGALAAPLLSASLGLGSNVIIDAFVIVMIGGMGSFIGTVAGSLLVGFAQTFGNFYVPELALGMTYALMITVLVLRPGGLFGRPE